MDYISKEEALSLLKEVKQEDAAKANKKKMQKEFVSKISYVLILILLSISMMISGYFLINYFVERHQANVNYDNAENEVFTSEIMPTEENTDETKIAITDLYKKESVLMENYNHKALLKINSDAAGYLQIPALGLALPVVYGNDNEFYLSHTIYKEYNANGCLFIDADNNTFLDQNCIIYGHDMKNGAMFGLLNRFMSNDLIEKDDENQYIYFYNENRIYQYKIYSVHTTEASRTTGSAYQLLFTDEDNFKAFAQNMQKKSFIDSNYEFKGNESTLTLSTCTNDANTRLVVQAVLINQMDLKGNVLQFS